MSQMKKPEICRILNFEMNETIQIFGENFDWRTGKVYWWRENEGEDKDRNLLLTPDDAKIPELPPENALVYKPAEVCDGRVLYVSCVDVPIRTGAAVMWVENEAGISKPFMANKPAIWTQSHQKVRPGDIISVHGANFGHLATRGALIKNSKGEYKEAIVSTPHEHYYPHDAFRHMAYIEIPFDTAEGEYEIYYHCGYGGALGWSDPVTVTVTKELSVTDYYRNRWSREVSVQPALPSCNKIIIEAAKEGAFVDKADEIQSACDKLAAEGGGIVILTAGCYGISKTIELRGGVVLQGAGDGATTIRTVQGCEIRQDWDKAAFAGPKGAGKPADWKPFWQKHRNGVLVRIFDDAGIDGIKLELAGAGIGVLISGDTDTSTVNGPFVTNCRIDNGCANTYYPGSWFGSISGGIIGICNTYELVVHNCNITALKPIELLPARHDYAKIIKNCFETSPKQMDQTFFGAMYNCMLVENQFLSGRRGFMTQGGFAYNWMYQNRTRDVARACNALELYMSEHGHGYWGGYAEEIGDNYIAVNKDNDILKTENNSLHAATTSMALVVNDGTCLAKSDRLICIVDGRGLGQYRKVIGIDGNKLILDRAWDITPDETTYFILCAQTLNNIYVDNETAFCNGHTQILWNGGIENIISGHNIDLSAGIRLHSDFQRNDYDKCAIMAFNYIIHCQVKASGKGLWFDTDTRCYDKHPAILKTKGLFGNTVRWNVFDGMHSMHYTKNLPEYVDLVPHAGIAVTGSYNSFTNNRVGGYKTGVKLLDQYAKGNYFEKTVFEDVAVRFGGAALPVGPDSKIMKD